MARKNFIQQLLLMCYMIKNAGAQLARGRFPLPFCKREEKCPDFAKKDALSFEKSPTYGYIYAVNSYLKFSFKSILKKKSNFFLARSFFCMSYMKRLLKCHCSKKPSLPQTVPDCVSEMNIHPAYTSKHNLHHENQIILSMTPKGEEWCYLAVKKTISIIKSNN